MRHVQDLGYTIAIITARQSDIISRRATDLGIPHVYQGIQEKGTCFDELCQKLNLTSEMATYMGDDEIDLPVLKKVGLATCPQDALPIVKEYCHWVSAYNGGLGAARELCDLFTNLKIS